jgi:protein-tyrosine phosphatase
MDHHSAETDAPGTARTSRIIPLTGGRNFRDLGGYATSDGRRVRWRRLFRSGVMSYLTDEDHAHLRPLGIRTICDLRTLRERQREPIRWHADPVDIMSWDYDNREVSLRAYLAGAALSPPVARGIMRTLYRRMPTVFRDQYTALFEKLAADDAPLVFNCSAGKDRTGMAAALVLSSLGVPRAEIMADYVLTDSAVDLERELFSGRCREVGLDDHSYLESVDPAARAPLLRALPEYLDAGLAQIETDHGSIENFVRGALGIQEEKLQRLRARLLES